MFPNQPPQPPPAGQEPQAFWLQYTPMGIVFAPGPPPLTLPDVPQKNQNEAQQPSTPQPLQLLAPQPFMIPIFGMPVPIMAGQPAQAQVPQSAPQNQSAPQQQQGGKSGAKKSPQGMGPLAPLPKATQDPRNPATLPSDYYSYRDKGLPAPEMWKRK